MSLRVRSLLSLLALIFSVITEVRAGTLITNPGGGIIIIDPGGGIIIGPPSFGGTFSSPAAVAPEIIDAPFAAASAEVAAAGDLPGDISPIAAVCDESRVYVVSKDGGAHAAGAIWSFALTPETIPQVEVLLDFPQENGLPGRTLLLKDRWLYGTTTANYATSGSTVFRFNLDSRAYETIANLPINSACAPVSLAFSPNGELFIATSRAAGAKVLPFSLTYFQTYVMNFAPELESGALFRLPADGGTLELVHTFKPGGLPGLTTIALNVPSEIVCDTDGVLYGTTTGRRIFTLVPGHSVRWVTGNTEEAIGEGAYGSYFSWNFNQVGNVQFTDRRVPLHVAENGIRFHPSSRGGASIQVLAGGQLQTAIGEKWPKELEFATHLFPAGQGQAVALLEAGNRRRLALTSSQGGIRPLPHLRGIGSVVAARAADNTLVASDLLPASGGQTPEAWRIKKLTLNANTPPVCADDYFQGASRLLIGNGYSQPYSLPHFFPVLQNDVDAEGDRLTLTKHTPVDGMLFVRWTLYLNFIGVMRLPMESVFEYQTIYTVSDGFGGEVEATAVFRNRAPHSENVSRPYSASGIEIAAAAFANDPDADWVYIKSVGNGAAIEVSNGGLSARFHVPSAGDFPVVVADKFGAETTAILRVQPAEPVTITQTLYLTTPTGKLSVPDVGLPAEQLIVTLVQSPSAGTVSFDNETAAYTAGPSFRISDSFTYQITSPYGVMATVTIHVQNVLPTLAGTYHGFGREDQSMLRMTIDANGRYTLVYRVGGRVYRKRGHVSTPADWLIPRPGDDLIVQIRTVSSPDPKVEIRTGWQGRSILPLRLLKPNELSAMRAPRVHAMLSNAVITPARLIFVGGAFHPVGKSSRKSLASSYAIFMRATGGGVTITGRLADGRPFASSGIVETGDTIAIFGDYFSGMLSARESGNIVGAIITRLPGLDPITTTVSGTPFRQPANGANVFGGKQAVVSMRSLFPADITVSGTIEADGRLTAAMPNRISQTLQVKSSDGLLAGKITTPTGQSQSANGLYIPHKKQVVGFIGESPGKPITIRRK